MQALLPLNRDQLLQSLIAPFPLGEVRFSAALVRGRLALALPYVDAAAIRNRLNDVFGAASWCEEYESLPEGSIVCRLKLHLGDEWQTMMGVGQLLSGNNARRSLGCRAFERAALRWGIGQYLCRVPAQWLEYDGQKEQFVQAPSLPLESTQKPRPATGRRGARTASRRKSVA